MLTSEDIILFGGFANGKPTNKVVVFKPEAEGSFEPLTNIQMQTPDHFPITGLLLKNSKQKDQLIFPGHRYNHLFKL